MSLVPARPLRGLPVGVRGLAEGGRGRRLFGAFGPEASEPACSSTAAASQLQQFYPDGVEFRTGALEFVHFVRPPGPGRYRACGWVEEPGDPAAEAAAGLAVVVPSTRTRTNTAFSGRVSRGSRRSEAWVQVRAKGVPLPVEAGRLAIEQANANALRLRFRRAGRPANLARSTRFDICIEENSIEDVVRVVVRHRRTATLRARYLPTADFRPSTGYPADTYPSPALRPRDIRGYDRERDRCGGRPVPSPVR
jgi:hypothetical protein